MDKYALELFGERLRETYVESNDCQFAYLLGLLDGVQEITEKLEAADRDARS